VLGYANPYQWQADVDTTVVIPALTLVYLYAVGRLGASRRQLLCFAAGMGLLAANFWTPLHHLGLYYLLSAHLARSRAWRGLTHPAVALPLWLADYFAWHVPAVYDYALTHQQWVIHAEHACYFGTGLLVWWPLVQDVPRRLASGRRAGYAFAAFVLASPLGLLLALLPKAVYPYYVDARPRVFGLSPLTDQEVAGVTMASEQAVVLFAVFLYWFRRFLAEEA
jgi:cytochrome c oxidase assembly factor CtaG